jgi:diguanylate cyclase (GGDEF)-like protein
MRFGAFRRWSTRALALLALLLAAMGLPAFALDHDKEFHHYVSNGWSIEQGLPQISALAISQDPQGYLWVGTQAGLARFDGHRFTAYTPASAPGLPGAFINALLADSQGRVWVGTYKGLARWHDGGFSHLAPDASEPQPMAPSIVALAEMSDSTVLAAAGEAVWAVEGEQLRLHTAVDKPVRALLSETDTLWIGSVGGVYRRSAEDAVAWQAFPRGARNASVRSLLRARGRLWAGTSEGLFVLDEGGWQRDPQLSELGTTPIESMLLDHDGNHWIAELAHLTRIRPDGSVERVVREGAALSIRSLFEDREHNLWLGSQWSGVTRLRNGWTRRFGERHGLATPLLWSVARGPDDALWVGSDDGLLRFADGRFEHVLRGSQLPHPSAYTLRVEDGRVWIGTRHGLAVYEAGEVQQPERFEPVASLQINGIVRDRSDALWLATSNGVFRDDGTRLHRYGEAEGLADPRARFLLELEDGRLLLGSQSGVFQLSGGRFERFEGGPGLPEGLDITSLHALPGGELLAGTLSERLYLLAGGRWHTLGPEQGMPANAPFFISHDDDWLWVGGIRGIGRVRLSDLREFAAGTLDQVHGEMLLNERGDRRGGQKGFCCNGAGNAKGLHAGSTLWAPSRDGLVALDTTDVRVPTQPPATLIERFRSQGQWQVLAEQVSMELPVDARDLAFEFTAISFFEPRSLGFRYRLLGYHEDWREPDQVGQRIASYTNLPGGDYRFEVQSSTAEGVWSEAAALELSIARRFAETRAFIASVVAAIALLGWLGYRLQRHRYRIRAAELEALVQQRTADLAEANQRLSEASLTDPLTGLRNRRYLSAQVPKDISFYAREHGSPQPPMEQRVLLFALADIDHFKRINDTHGHAAGDRVLQQFADILQTLVRTGDYVARWGGEEFVLVFRPMPIEFMAMLGERLRAAVAGHDFDIGTGIPLKVTCSIGLCQYPLLPGGTRTLEWEHLLELADRALYRIKREGRNGWGAYRAREGTEVEQVLELLREGEQALEDSELLEFVRGDRDRSNSDN